MTLISRAGTALYGPRWQREMARELGVADRTVRRWVTGEDIPRPGVYADLLRLATERQIALNEIVDALRGETENAA